MSAVYSDLEVRIVTDVIFSIGIFIPIYWETRKKMRTVQTNKLTITSMLEITTPFLWWVKACMRPTKPYSSREGLLAFSLIAGL